MLCCHTVISQYPITTMTSQSSNQCLISTLIVKGKNMLLLIVGLTLIQGLSPQETEREELVVTLAPGTETNIDLHINQGTYLKGNISPFLNQQSLASSFPCSLQRASSSAFVDEGRIDYQWSSPTLQDVWMGGPLWDAIQTDGLVMSVMNSGEVGYFRLAELEEEGQGVKGRIIRPFQNNPIQKGRLIILLDEQGQRRILYFSQQGCYLINEINSTWIQLSNFSGKRVEQVKIKDNFIYAADLNQIEVFSVNFHTLSMESQNKYVFYFREGELNRSLIISDFQIDANFNRVFLVDSYQGIKYAQLVQNEGPIEAKSILATQKCQDIQLIQNLLLISCSHLVLVNSSSLSLLHQAPYHFQINRIFYNQGWVTAFGDHQYTIFSIAADIQSKSRLKIEEISTGVLPSVIIQHILYLPQTQHYLLFSKNSVVYGKSPPNSLKMECHYHRVAHEEAREQLLGDNKGVITIFQRCSKTQTSGFYSQCQKSIEVIVKVEDSKYGKTFWVLFIILWAWIITLTTKIYGLKKQKKVKYHDLQEQVEDAGSSSAGEKVPTGQTIELAS